MHNKISIILFFLFTQNVPKRVNGSVLEPYDQIDRIMRNRVLITQVTEKKVVIHKERKICLACRGAILGYMNTCSCDSIYCENYGRALTDLENECWVCNPRLISQNLLSPKRNKKWIKMM